MVNGLTYYPEEKTTSGFKTTIWVTSTSDSNIQKSIDIETKGGNYIFRGWSPDGNMLVFTESYGPFEVAVPCKDDLTLISFSEQNLKLLTTFPFGTFFENSCVNYYWSPDSKLLAIFPYNELLQSTLRFKIIDPHGNTQKEVYINLNNIFSQLSVTNFSDVSVSDIKWMPEGILFNFYNWERHTYGYYLYNIEADSIRPVLMVNRPYAISGFNSDFSKAMITNASEENSYDGRVIDGIVKIINLNNGMVEKEYAFANKRIGCSSFPGRLQMGCTLINYPSTYDQWFLIWDWETMQFYDYGSIADSWGWRSGYGGYVVMKFTDPDSYVPYFEVLR